MSDKPTYTRINVDITPMGHMRAAPEWTFVAPADSEDHAATKTIYLLWATYGGSNDPTRELLGCYEDRVMAETECERMNTQARGEYYLDEEKLILAPTSPL